MNKRAYEKLLNEDNFQDMHAYKQQPYRRHKVRLDGYDVNYILTSFDVDDRLQQQAL